MSGSRRKPGPLGPFVTPDKYLDCVIEAGQYLDQKMNAMKAHATQITVDGPFFALSNADVVVSSERARG